MKTIRTDRARAKFIEHLAASCNVSAACRAANISRAAAYAWRAEDDAFSQEWADAEAEAIDNLEGVAYERAMTGQSDRMVEILLKGHRPERYVERRQHELSGPGGNPIAFTGIDICIVDPTKP